MNQENIFENILKGQINYQNHILFIRYAFTSKFFPAIQLIVFENLNGSRF